MENKFDKDNVIHVLREIKQAEITGVIKYTNYSCVIVGPYRLALMSWFKEQANESLEHANLVNEYLSFCDAAEHFKLEFNERIDHDVKVEKLLQNSLGHEEFAVKLYTKLLDLVDGKSVYLEDFARRMIGEETAHINDVRKLIINL